MIEFKLPAVGENVDKADVGALRVAVGDVIAADQIVMEIETDKAVFELPCPHAGKIAKIHVKQGDEVQTGAILLTIDESAAVGGKPQPSKSAPAEEPKTPAAEKKTAPAKPTKPSEPAPSAPSTPAKAAAPARTKVAAAPPPPPESVVEVEEEPAPAGPATRRLARELGVNLHQVTGSGRGGRITAEDVQAYVRERLAAAEAA